MVIVNRSLYITYTCFSVNENLNLNKQSSAVQSSFTQKNISYKMLCYLTPFLSCASYSCPTCKSILLALKWIDILDQLVYIIIPSIPLDWRHQRMLKKRMKTKYGQLSMVILMLSHHYLKLRWETWLEYQNIGLFLLKVMKLTSQKNCSK